MTNFCVAATLAVGLITTQGISSHPGLQSGPDVSGRWNRESVTGGSGSAEGSRWGSRVQIDQSGVIAIVRPSSGKPERLRLDGVETAEVLSIDGCKNTSRVTKAVLGRDRLTITTWLVTKLRCVHGEDEDDPRITRLGDVEPGEVLGTRKPESITVIYREGDVMTVETTSGSGSRVTTTTTTYRK